MTRNLSSPSCWAASIGQCDEKITREHVVSRCLFEGDEITVQGFPWCPDEPKTIGLSNLVAKILCKKHNSNLSGLDEAALAAFNIFRESIRMNDVRGKLRPTFWNVKRFTIDGPLLERWFLKTLINLSFRREWIIGPGSHLEGTPSKELVEIAFGLREFQDGAGLYMAADRGEQIDSMDRVNCSPMTEGTNVVAGRFNFRGYRFYLNLLSEKLDTHVPSQVLYRGVTLRCTIRERLSHIIELKW